MLEILKSESRGSYNYSWIDSKNTFSFSQHYDSNFLGFSVLNVINEDRISPDRGYSEIFHKNIEILTYVISGSLKHKDSMGNETILEAGDIQILSTGNGVKHSEYNNSSDKELHLLQVWMAPEYEDVEPKYERLSFSEVFKCSDVALVATGSGRGGTVIVNQDVDIYIGKALSDGVKTLKTFLYRKSWIQVIAGEIRVLDMVLKTGDSVGLSDVNEYSIHYYQGSEFIIFDLP